MNNRIYCELCDKNGFACIKSSMRNHLSGIDIGIVKTGTLGINCPSGILRLATMLCEYHICMLPHSRILTDAFAVDQQLPFHMQTAPNYTAFITGADRTADIERVLTLSVNNPLE